MGKEAYEQELQLLKDKQKDIYLDFIYDYNIKRDELELNYQNIIEIAKKKNSVERKEIRKNNLKKENKLVNKKILILEDKLKKLFKLKLFKEAGKIKLELENEKNILKKKISLEKIKMNKLEINNLNNKQNKKMNNIKLKYNKKRNDLELLFNKEKKELLQKFKNQLNDFEMFKNRKNQNKKNKYIINNGDYLFNISFDKEILDKKIEDEEESLKDNK